MSQHWPDALTQPNSQKVPELLADFWLRLADLAHLIAHDEHLLSAECTAEMRRIVVSLVLALNGIARPDATRDLNAYLSPRQRRALERTLVMPAANRDDWIGQAVAMVVIYRWYAPQLVDKFHVPYPNVAEHDALRRLSAALPDWPRSITTD